MAKSLPYHKEVLGLVEDIATLNRHIGPDELIALWFDTLYFPAQSYVDAKGQAEWASCFSFSELAALAKFNALFNHVVDELPKGAIWWESENWLRLSAAAEIAIKEAAGDI